MRLGLGLEPGYEAGLGIRPGYEARARARARAWV